VQHPERLLVAAARVVDDVGGEEQRIGVVLREWTRIEGARERWVDASVSKRSY
jgi:hypothetical protein